MEQKSQSNFSLCRGLSLGIYILVAKLYFFKQDVPLCELNSMNNAAAIQ